MTEYKQIVDLVILKNLGAGSRTDIRVSEKLSLLGVDSLKLLLIMLELEERLALNSIQYSGIADIDTVDDIYSLVSKLVTAQP